MGEFNEIYKSLCEDLLSADVVGETREVCGAMFTLQNIDSVFSTVRNPSLRYTCAELVWYLSGSRDVRFIGQFASLWKDISDDGVTSNSCYGYLIHKAHGFDQMEKVIELLRADPDSRRAVINLNVPNPKVIETKDEPCTIALQFLIRDRALDCIAMMRSNDIWTGLPYDVMYFTTLQKIIADTLDADYGSYTHVAGSMHVYLKDEGKITDRLSQNRVYSFRINHTKLKKYAEFLHEVATPDNILDLCRDAGVLID